MKDQETTAVETEETPLPVLSKAGILATELRRVCVQVPEMGGRVWLQELSSSQRDDYEAHMLGQPEPLDLHAIMTKPLTPIEKWKDARARLLSMSIIDEEGNRLFSKTDIEALGSKSGKALQRLFNEACTLSGLS